MKSGRMHDIVLYLVLSSSDISFQDARNAAQFYKENKETVRLLVPNVASATTVVT